MWLPAAHIERMYMGIRLALKLEHSPAPSCQPTVMHRESCLPTESFEMSQLQFQNLMASSDESHNLTGVHQPFLQMEDTQTQTQTRAVMAIVRTHPGRLLLDRPFWTIANYTVVHITRTKQTVTCSPTMSPSLKASTCSTTCV